jgi:hypothetical protein
MRLRTSPAQALAAAGRQLAPEYACYRACLDQYRPLRPGGEQDPEVARNHWAKGRASGRNGDRAFAALFRPLLTGPQPDHSRSAVVGGLVCAALSASPPGRVRGRG